MTQKINTQIPEATDVEATERRNSLIESGVITPGSPVERAAAIPLNELTPFEARLLFIKDGAIKPVERLSDNTVTYCELPASRNVKSTNVEEGEYRVKPIVSEEDYSRRKMVYFRSLQELLFARRDLNLIVGKKELTDPEWFF